MREVLSLTQLKELAIWSTADQKRASDGQANEAWPHKANKE